MGGEGTHKSRVKLTKARQIMYSESTYPIPTYRQGHRHTHTHKYPEGHGPSRLVRSSTRRATRTSVARRSEDPGASESDGRTRRQRDASRRTRCQRDASRVESSVQRSSRQPKLSFFDCAATLFTLVQGGRGHLLPPHSPSLDGFGVQNALVALSLAKTGANAVDWTGGV